MQRRTTGCCIKRRTSRCALRACLRAVDTPAAASVGDRCDSGPPNHRPDHTAPAQQVAGGNGEQVISRDVNRLATRLDFFRLLSFYHTGPGFFINTALMTHSVWVTLWAYLLLTLTGSVTYAGPDGEAMSTITGAFAGASSLPFA